MRTSQTLFTIALIFAVVHQASCQLDVSVVFGPGAPTITKPQLDQIQGSVGLKIALNRYLFDEADLDMDGYLSLAEFAPIYDRFITVMTGESPPTTLINARFDLADNIITDNKLGPNEFAFLVGIDFSFLYQTYDVRTGPTGALQTVIDLILGLFSNPAFTTLFNIFLIPFQGVPITISILRTIFEFIAGFLGITLNFTDCVLNGLLNWFDTNMDGIVDLNELLNLLPDFLETLAQLLELNLGDTTDPNEFFC